MKRILLIALAAFFVGNTAGYSEDVSFGNVKLAGAKGKQTDATLIFSDAKKSVLIHLPHRGQVSIPYSDIDHLSYEYTRKHRVTAGTINLASSPGTGAPTMLAKSKGNWFCIDYHYKDSRESIVLKLEKKDIQSIFQTAKDHTGKEVVDLGNTGKSKSQKLSGL